jgi:hypothetical protein
MSNGNNVRSFSLGLVMSTPDTAPKGTVRFSTCGDASALHASWPNGANLVAIGNLRVLVRQDADDVWVAQGLEIDYCAEGDTKEEAQEAFATGLQLTIRENLRMFQSLSGILKTAPPETWNDFLTCVMAEQLVLTQTSLHDIAGIPVSVYMPKAA